MFRAIGKFFRPMTRTIWIALAGQGFFLLSVLTMSPLRIWKNPVENYNLFYLPILLLFFGFLFYRCCVEEEESRAYLYGFFAALFAWPIVGEVANIPVEKGVITQFSDMNIKLLGGYYHVLFCWVALKILWLTGALKRPVCVFLLVFLCIWSFELYMDNYSSRVPVALMPMIGNAVAGVAAVLSLIILWIAKRSESFEKKTVLGCLLYITVSLVLMGSGPWQTPSKFYIKYESAHIDESIRDLQQEKAHLQDLKQWMILQGLVTPDELEQPAGDTAGAGIDNNNELHE